MEELKLLVEMVASLPTLAVWVVAAFYLYKISIIGSIYGVIRFAISKLHDWSITRKTLPPIVQEISLRDMLNGICISDEATKNLMMAQIRRICGKNLSIDSDYIHERSVDWLREAINAKEAEDVKKSKKVQS
jgi:hypothetical protein